MAVNSNIFLKYLMILLETILVCIGIEIKTIFCVLLDTITACSGNHEKLLMAIK